MSRQEQEQFTVYAAEAAVPRYQRAWVWGLAALAILLCGLAAGWLMGGAGSSFQGGARSGIHAVDSAVLLVQREAANDELRGRIARLEQALRGDVCAPAALEALQPASR
ncbi:MAG: hypothetical protein F9K25_20050 [Candidatus Contendobacter sp.]|nr:MAG: hypothetical protein F9K25_20050 [Candidatus Contendobacter sp.]